MKYRLAVLLMVFCLLPLSAQIPQWGKYYFEIVGTDAVIDVEINGNQWDFDLGDGIKSRQSVIIDNSKKTIKIPIFAGYADDFTYEEKNDYIDFYRGESFNLNLYELMTQSIIGLRGIYGVSRPFAETIMDDLRESFSKAPLLRLRRGM